MNNSRVVQPVAVAYTNIIHYVMHYVLIVLQTNRSCYSVTHYSNV